MKALLFDTFGTLVDWRSSLIDAFSRFGKERQIDGVYCVTSLKEFLFGIGYPDILELK